MRHNALRHGLLSDRALLVDEDPAALAALCEGLRTNLQPVGELESLLVDRIASATWRLRRLGRLEASLFAWGMECAARARDRRGTSQLDQLLSDLQGAATPEAEAEMADLERLIDKQAAVFGQSWLTLASTPDAYTKLSRYEAGIERGLYKALHELQRLQAARAGEAVPLPATIEVNVSAPDMNGFVS